MLADRDHQLGEIIARADDARAGRGGMVFVSGESGAGKTSFVEAFVDHWVKDERVLWGACDPLPTPRPLGPIHDFAHRLAPATRAVLAESDQPYDIFDAVYDDLRTAPSVLVLDDLQWADQGTIDLLRFVLRRVSQTRSLAVGIVRDDEVGVGHPLRVLLGDAARSTRADVAAAAAAQRDAVEPLVGESAVDPAWLHRVTGGNAFFVCEMLEHQHARTDLPTTVRDAVLARTSDLDPAAWDALNLLTCSPGAVPDRLLTDLGVTLPALRALSDAGLIRRSSRGVAFRHDLCRMAISSVIPPGAEPGLHRRLLDAYEATSHVDPAVLTHHALGRRGRRADSAGRLRRGHCGCPVRRAHPGRRVLHDRAGSGWRTGRRGRGGTARAAGLGVLPDRQAARCDQRLPARDADSTRSWASRRRSARTTTRLSVYQWYNANRELAEGHAVEAMTVLDDRVRRC